MLLSKGVNSSGNAWDSFGPIPLGWRVRAISFDLAPFDPLVASTLAVRIGFLPSPLTAAVGDGTFGGTQLLQRSNRMVAGSRTEAVTLFSVPGSAGAYYPQRRVVIPCVLPIDVDWEIYLGVEYTTTSNIVGVASVDLIPLTPVELARSRRAFRSYLLDDVFSEQ